MILVEQDDFDEGDAPEVLTGTSMSCEGGKHEECPGSYDVPEHGDAVVFCMCSCHRVVPGYEDWPIIAHADVGGGHCDGCIFPVIRDDQAAITCNSCGAVVRTVAVADLQRALDAIELSLDATATELCPHCGKVNIFPGWSSLMAYTCRGCGRLVRWSDDPSVEKFFGPEEH